MTETGQKSAQIEQPMHAAVIVARTASTAIAETGQSAAHPPHPVQLLESTSYRFLKITPWVIG